MEDGNIHLLAQLRFDLEAFRRLDVLKIDAAEGWLQRRDGGDHGRYGGSIDLYVENVDAREFLE
ncbi:hypothetical protein D3C87_2210560 [compost metagenome]